MLLGIPNVSEALEHRNFTYGSHRRKLEIQKGKPGLQATTIHSRFIRQCPMVSRDNMSAMCVLVTRAETRATQEKESQI